MAKEAKQNMQTDERNTITTTGQSVADFKRNEEMENRVTNEMIHRINMQCNDLHKKDGEYCDNIKFTEDMCF